MNGEDIFAYPCSGLLMVASGNDNFGNVTKVADNVSIKFHTFYTSSRIDANRGGVVGLAMVMWVLELGFDRLKRYTNKSEQNKIQSYCRKVQTSILRKLFKNWFQSESMHSIEYCKTEVKFIPGLAF